MELFPVFNASGEENQSGMIKGGGKISKGRGGEKNQRPLNYIHPWLYRTASPSEPLPKKIRL